MARGAVMDLVPGTQVERYLVVSRIGAGRMSTTYEVRHVTLNTPHALVVPNEPIRGLLLRMVAGAKIQARLRHPGVVSATDVLDLEGLPALVLDHVEGPNLEEFVSSHDLDEPSIDAIAGGLIDAVGWLHRNSVLHRHLKPQNVMVDLGGDLVVPRITDFTLARLMGHTGAKRVRKKPRVFGTASYMSPEQTRDSDLVGPPADIWSLGCILYYLCTGEAAFDGPDPETTFEAVRAGRYKSLDQRILGAPPRWGKAIARALVVDDDDRVPTAEALGELWFEGTSERPGMSSKTAPVGRVTLVFTDIQGSTRLWEQAQEVARHSLRAHDAVMRASLHRHGGYEVKTEGDAFMVAFAHPVSALEFCLEVQRELHAHPWSPDLLALPEAAEAPGFRGLRVRMGVHIGEPEARTRGNKVDYFGPMVNRAARIASAGHGGQILASKEAWNLARSKLRDDTAATRLGEFGLRGLAGTQEIVQVLPVELAERTFPPIKADLQS